MWFWICLAVSAVFLIFWLWFNSDKPLVQVVLIIVMADYFLTLIDQPSSYWQNYLHYDESAFIGTILLNLHPLVFTFGIIIWVMFATLLIKKLAPLFSHALFLALSMGHALGVWDRIQFSWSVLHQEISKYLFLIFLALIFAFVLERVRGKK